MSALTAIPVFLAAAVVLGGAKLFCRGFRLWRHARLIEDTPTSNIRSMALGRVELRGRAVPRRLVESPITARPCIYYRYRVAEKDGDTWKTILKGESSRCVFELEDDTGRVPVDPEGAEIQFARFKYVGSKPELHAGLAAFLAANRIGLEDGYNFFEWRVDPGEALYVLGTASERSPREWVAMQLAEIKQDPVAMALADNDRDGHVSSREWDRVRHEAADPAAASDRVVIARDPIARAPFLISSRGEHAITQRSHWRALLEVVAGIFFCVGGLAFLIRAFG